MIYIAMLGGTFFALMMLIGFLSMVMRFTGMVVEATMQQAALFGSGLAPGMAEKVFAAARRAVPTKPVVVPDPASVEAKEQAEAEAVLEKYRESIEVMGMLAVTSKQDLDTRYGHIFSRVHRDKLHTAFFEEKTKAAYDVICKRHGWGGGNV